MPMASRHLRLTVRFRGPVIDCVFDHTPQRASRVPTELPHCTVAHLRSQLLMRSRVRPPTGNFRIDLDRLDVAVMNSSS